MRGEWDKVNNDVLWSEDNPKRQLIVQAARARLWQVVNELREIVDSMEINNMDYTARMVIEETFNKKYVIFFYG